MKIHEPLVIREFVGEMHVEGKRLIVGDTDVVDVVVASWGGNRQMGRLMVTWEPITSESQGVSPSYNGTFAERSEP